MNNNDLHRFMLKVRITPQGCWLWKAGCTGHGYAAFWLNGRTRPAHIVSHEQFIGPIPEGLEIDHLCKRVNCVSPLHIEAVTHTVNIRRRRPIFSLSRRRTHCKNGHKFTKANTRTRPDGYRDCKACNRVATQKYYRTTRAA